MGIQNLCFDMQCLFLFHGLQMHTISTFHISQLSNKNLSFKQKKTLVSLHKLCIWSWIIYLSQRGPSLISHYFFTYIFEKLTTINIKNLLTSLVCSKFAQNLLFHRFVWLKIFHLIYTCFKCMSHDICV